MTLLDADRTTWVAVCRLDRLVTGRGQAALVGGRAVALFRFDDDSVRAIDNVDPCSGASVLSRGLVGHTLEDGRAVRYVASPLRKQRFDLDSGRCLDAASGVDTWATQVVDGVVEVTSQPSRWSNGPETAP
ncbi:nitrite reductase small subunit NirD [Aquihabitans daechungensis]|uniref:nitrite reductase small subunit NirD n=1 Tax=Aquihabitans daechungensis TaxID=1052257 RepID=UPI003BA02F4A